ncbi:MAG TPA: HupE/UreJ family protein [Noviherbaspirillum sp.]|jgi:urease accessory protein|uniref:HupE/UreJ family protein n=1 Tax=Noviherbaspirillum sp. TaxID=1926288 RepID=UPI002F93EEC0
MPLTSSIRARSIIGLAACLLAMPAFAHPGAHHVAGFPAGFLHPLAGWDHLLAMVAVGAWAAQQRRPAWHLLAVFPAVMASGAVLALAGFVLPHVEAGIAASVLVLGLLVAFSVRMPAAAGAVLVAAFALLHGFAHGAEFPAGASVAGYGAGFLLSTLLLHLGGAFASRSLQAWRLAAVRAAGVGVALSGAWMLAGA